MSALWTLLARRTSDMGPDRDPAVAPGKTGLIPEPHPSLHLRRYDALNRELRFPPRTSLSSR